MPEVRGTQPLLEGLEALLSSDREELLIGFGHGAVDSDWLLLVDGCRLAGEHEVKRDANGLHWTGELTSALYAEAKSSDRGVVLIHAHGGQGRLPQPSRTDLKTADEILPHFGMLLPDVPHAYVVVNRTNACGWMQLANDRKGVEDVRVSTLPIRHWPSEVVGEPKPLTRDDRPARALGSRGIGAIRRSTIGIVGLGGAGSQVAEMLAHAGVGHLILVDADVVKEVNLSRTHGTTPEAIGEFKVATAGRLVARISPESKVTTVEEAFPSRSLLRVLRDVDVIISCVDNPNARNEVNRFSLRYAIPLIDLGTTISEEPFRVDGHLSVVVPGSHCLRCLGHVSDVILAADAEAARGGRYGMSEGRPQVVSFNGLLASAAVTETLKLLTGFAGNSFTSMEWHYDAVGGELRRIKTADGRCRECSWYSFKGDGA